jgi:hypothetical protein
MAAQLQHFKHLSPSASGGRSERSEDNPFLNSFFNPLLECFPLQQQKMAAQLQHFKHLSLRHQRSAKCHPQLSTNQKIHKN